MTQRHLPCHGQPAHFDTTHRREADATGFTLLIVLVTLAVAMAFFVAITRSMLVVRKTIDLQARQSQTECLAVSGYRRAVAKLAGDEKYTGETWHLSPAEMAGRDAATVRIRVVADAAKAMATIHIDADYPDDPLDRARASQDFQYRWTKGAK